MKVRQILNMSLKLSALAFLTVFAVVSMATQAFAQIMVGVGQGGTGLLKV